MNQETKDEVVKYKPSKKFWLVMIAILVVFYILLRPTEEGKVSSALRDSLSAQLTTGSIYDAGFDINWIEIKGDRAEISYKLSGGNYKATAIKTNGKWIIR